MANLDNAKEIGFGVVSQNNIGTYAPEAVVTSTSTPSSPVSGLLWFNPSEKTLRVYDGTSWQVVKQSFDATGGTYTEVNGYGVHTFTSSGTFTVTSGQNSVEYIIVAGGGGNNYGYTGGGGAGGYRSSISGAPSGGGTSAENSMLLTEGNYSVVVGAGGAGLTNGQNGSNSSFNGIVSLGGGRGGGGTGYSSASGGSGGGGGPQTQMPSGSPGTAGQGYAGGSSPSNEGTAGGGGAAGVGGDCVSSTGGAAGAGITTTVTGTSLVLAKGGRGANNNEVTATNGASNTGEGAWGNYSGSSQGNYGGSGIVIIRYPI